MWHQAAAAYQVKNFYYQIFSNIDYEIVPLLECEEKFFCEIIGDRTRFAIKDYHVATVAASINHRISVDVFCSAMPVGDWYNLIHMTTGGNNAVLGERFFLISQAGFTKLSIVY